MLLFSPSASDTLSQQPPQGSGDWFSIDHISTSASCFKMSFHVVLFTAPSPSPGGDEKVILIFQRTPVNYSTGLCIAYSLQAQCENRSYTQIFKNCHI